MRTVLPALYRTGEGGLCPGGLYPEESLSRDVSVQVIFFPGGLYLGGFCPVGLWLGDLCQGDSPPPEGTWD